MFRTDDLGLLGGLVRAHGDGVELGVGDACVSLDLRSGVLSRQQGKETLPLDRITALSASGNESGRFRIVVEQRADRPILLLEVDGYVSNTEVSRLLERLAWLLRVPFRRPAEVGGKPDVYLYRGGDKFLAFLASLDPLIATALAIFGKRGTFLRFYALQRLTSLAVYDVPLMTLLVVVVALQVSAEKPGENVVAWGGLILLVPLLVVVALRFVAAVIGAQGRIYVVPGLGWLVRRWLPTELPPTSDPRLSANVSQMGAPAVGVVPTAVVSGLDSQGVNPIQTPAVSRSPARVPIWVWILLFVLFAPFAGCVSLIGYAAAVGPDLEAKPGSQTPKRFLQTIRARGLLAPTETPTYFYSDGFTDIEEGMYFFTDRKLVVYSSEWDPPAVVVPLTDITRMDLTRSTSWLDDSTIVVQYGGGGVLEIPIAREKDGDVRFFQALETAWKKSAP